jgi:ABC-type siderophore export system fused ATPase/permease subunit
MGDQSTPYILQQASTNILLGIGGKTQAALGQDVATQSDLEEAVQQQKSTAFGAAIQDLTTSTNAAHALYYYGLRNNDLKTAQDIALNTITGSVNQMNSDKALSKRQHEINEWTANNKLDTLFVYQQLLIILCTTIVLVYLLKRGLISTTVFFIIIITIGLIFIFTIINRVQYTNKLRDGRFWNKRSFELVTPVDNICPSIDMTAIKNSFNKLKDRATALGSSISEELNAPV